MTNTYPQLEKLFQPGAAEPALRRIESTRQQLSEIAKTNPKEKPRATAAFDAYTKALALIREIAGVRQKLAEEATVAPSAR